LLGQNGLKLQVEAEGHKTTICLLNTKIWLWLKLKKKNKKKYARQKLKQKSREAFGSPNWFWFLILILNWICILFVCFFFRALHLSCTHVKIISKQPTAFYTQEKKRKINKITHSQEKQALNSISRIPRLPFQFALRLFIFFAARFHFDLFDIFALTSQILLSLSEKLL